MLAILTLVGCATESDQSARRAPPIPPAEPATPMPTAAAGDGPRSTASSSPYAEPASRAAKPRRTSVTVVMNGDLLWHNTFWYGAREDARRRGPVGYDFAPLLAGMRPVIAGPTWRSATRSCRSLRPAGRSATTRGSPSRRRSCEAIKATGYDVCTTASNHSVDHGFGGLKRTLDDLDRAGIAHVGTARTEAEAQRPTIVTTRQGVKVGDRRRHLQPERPPHAGGQAMGGDRTRAPRRCWLRPAGPGRPEPTSSWSRPMSAPSSPRGRTPSSGALARALTASPDVDLVYMHHTACRAALDHGERQVGDLRPGQHGGPARDQHAAGRRGRDRAVHASTRGRNGRFTVTKAEYIPTLVTRYRPGRPARLLSGLGGAADGPRRIPGTAPDAQRRTTAVVDALRSAGLVAPEPALRSTIASAACRRTSVAGSARRTAACSGRGDTVLG